MASLSSEFQSRIDALCPAYLQFLAENETDVCVSDVVFLYGQNTIEERNATNEVANYLPDYVSIGNDSGDYEFLLRRDGSETVVWEDSGSFSAPSHETIHSSFPVWLANGCPLPKEPPCPIPLQGQIWLLSAPSGGIKDLFRIAKLLSQIWSIPQMKQSLERLPALLIDDGRPFRVHRMLGQHRDFLPHLGFSRRGDAAIYPFADFD